MMLLINSLQTVERHVCVNLRSRNIGVAQDGLDGPEICAVLHHVCGATVAQHMRAGVATCAQRSGANNLPDALPPQLAGASSQNKTGRAVSSHKYVARFFHVLGERLLSGLA